MDVSRDNYTNFGILPVGEKGSAKVFIEEVRYKQEFKEERDGTTQRFWERPFLPRGSATEYGL